MNLEMTEKRLLKILIHGTDKELAEIIEDIHPADILDAIERFIYFESKKRLS